MRIAAFVPQNLQGRLSEPYADIVKDTVADSVPILGTSRLITNGASTASIVISGITDVLTIVDGVGEVLKVASTVLKIDAEVAKISAAEARAIELHQMLSPRTQRATTIAVTKTREGIDIISSSEKNTQP